MSKVYPIIFVLDCSGSMVGEPIAIINETIKRLPKYISEYNSKDEIIKIGILSFSNCAKWMTEDLVPIENYDFNEMQTYGLTNLGAAINMLTYSLSREFIDNSCLNKICKPVIVFMTDGQPTDFWERELENSNQNKWLKYSARIAIGFNGSDEYCLQKLVIDKNAFL